MLDGIYVSMGNPVKGEDAGLDWYMNKSFKSKTVKVLSSVHGGYCKMRFMDDLLRGQLNLQHAEPEPKTEVSTSKGRISVSDATKPEFDANTNLTEDDEDDDIGNMTLKEMHRILKKSAQKFSKKQSRAVSSALWPPWGKTPAADTMAIPDCSLELSSLELHLDSSTSNSAESSDDLSPHDIATSFHKPVDRVVHESEVVVQMVDCPGLAPRKRKSTFDSVVCKSEIFVEDDDCTLEMWQVHKRRSHVGKKSRRCGVERAPCMDEQTFCESSMTPAATLALCSINSAPDVDEYLDSTCFSEVDSALGNFEQGSSALSCSFDCSRELIENSLEPQNDLITSAIAIEGNTDKIRSKVKMNVREKTTREDVKSDRCTQQHGPLLCESPPDCSSGKSSLVNEAVRVPLLTEAGSWLLKPCSKPLPIEVSSSMQRKLESNGQEPTLSCDVLHCLDHGPSPATVPESGQSSLEEEAQSNKAISAATVMKTFICPAGITIDNEVADLSQNKNTNEFSSVDLSKYSPPLPAKPKTGFDGAEQSNSTMIMASQPLFDEDTSGSPVSLFSTERLDTEEEQLAQVKPSKIPCKRKAISPLSRERLLQASKYGDRERNFQDLDKRGLKKLPRAFKGFIGRDMFNQEHVDAFARAKTLESSPPEKSHMKEEVIPGSPCHNREKFLPSKHFAPKVSALSSSYGSSCAAAPASPTMQTSSQSPSYVQRLSLVLNSSPSPPLQESLRASNSNSSPNNSPPIPAKGILRSSSPSCQGACKCEECVSMRCRAEKAAEFSQRQMHDIEGLAVKLLKELNTMRHVIEESLIHKNDPRADSPRSALSLEQVKKATNNAFETEKMAKSWLVRMARDCNRYCKIMRMQERKLTFADESGGQLCHVKLFHAQQAQAQPDTVLSTEKPAMPSAKAGLSDGPAMDVAS